VDRDVVRRFEVRVSDAARVADALNTAAADQHVTIAIDPKKPQNRDTFTVRLNGTAEATAAVRGAVPAGARITRDLLDLAYGARPPGAPPSSAYPDRRVLARIDPAGLAPADPAPKDRVVVAIVDSGIDAGHEDLIGHLWRGNAEHGACVMDAPGHAHGTLDEAGHGTMLAGTILATASGGAGIELMAVKIFDAHTEPTEATAAAGIRKAVELGADILNLSFDLGIGSRDLRNAIGEACRAGKLLVFAAGNTGSNNDKYPLAPARYAGNWPDSTLVVMASDWYDDRPTFSNFGRQSVDVAAPGVRIVSTRAGGRGEHKYGVYTGTSPAAAHVTGALARLKAHCPGMKPNALKQLLLDQAEEIRAMTVPRPKCSSGKRLRLTRLG